MLLGAVGWLTYGRLSGSSGADLTETYLVKPISFPVLLKEKGEIKAKESIDIKCEVEGRSTIIWLIEEGSYVKKGDLLVELASEDIDERIRNQEIQLANKTAAYQSAQKEYEIQLDRNASEIRKAELKLKLAELELEKYQKGDYMQRLREADLAVERAQVVLQRKRSDVATSRKLAEKGYITKAELEQDEFEYYEAQVELEKAKLAKHILVTYTHPKELAQKQADVEEARKELERVKKSAKASEQKYQAERDGRKAELEIVRERLSKLREQKAKCKIYAPAPGLVVYHTGGRWWNRDRIVEGAEVRERQKLITLPDTSVMQVRVRVHEAKRNLVQKGQPAIVEVDSLPGKQFSGVVTKVAEVADSQNRWLNPDLKEFETIITLDQADPNLKPGASATVQIIVDRLDNVLAVPVQAVFAKGPKRYVFVGSRPDQAKPAEVKLGISSTDYVEVLEGLAQGQRVLLTVPDHLKHQLPDVTEPQELAELPPPAGRQLPAGRSGQRTNPHRRPPRRAAANSAEQAGQASSGDSPATPKRSSGKNRSSTRRSIE